MLTTNDNGPSDKEFIDLQIRSKTASAYVRAALYSAGCRNYTYRMPLIMRNKSKILGNFSHDPREHSCPKRGVPGWANSQPVISDRKRNKTHRDRWLKTFVGSTNIYIIFATRPTSNWALIYFDVGTSSGADHRRFISFPGRQIINYSIFYVQSFMSKRDPDRIAQTLPTKRWKNPFPSKLHDS